MYFIIKYVALHHIHFFIFFHYPMTHLAIYILRIPYPFSTNCIVSSTKVNWFLGQYRRLLMQLQFKSFFLWIENWLIDDSEMREKNYLIFWQNFFNDKWLFKGDEGGIPGTSSPKKDDHHMILIRTTYFFIIISFHTISFAQLAVIPIKMESITWIAHLDY